MSDRTTEFVKVLSSTVPHDLNVVYMCNSGAEAADLAVRISKKYTGNSALITMENSFHGNLATTLLISPSVNHPCRQRQLEKQQLGPPPGQHQLQQLGDGQQQQHHTVHVLPVPDVSVAPSGCSNVTGEGLKPSQEESKVIEAAVIQVCRERTLLLLLVI